MRSSSAGEQTLLAATFRKTYYRVKIADPDDVMQDMASYASYGWLVSVTVDDVKDQPVAGCTVRLRREIDLVGGLGHTSLSPLRTDSPANPDGPAVTVNRKLWVEMAVVTGNRPADASTDWKRIFVGSIDRVSDISATTMTITARDKGATLQDQSVTAVGNAVPTGPRYLESVVNTLLLQATPGTFFAPFAHEVVYLPAAVDYALTSFPFKYEPIMDAIQRAVGLVGADFRYRWYEAGSDFLPTLTVPDRTPASTDFTLGSSGIVGWRQLEIDRLGVRNVITISYRNKTTGLRTTYTAEDETSKTLYGRRVLVIQEADDSAIDTATEAQTLADLILADLKDPVATAEVEILPDWRLELDDYGTFSANRFFDIDQDLAIVGIRHVLEPNQQRTFLTLRGTPSGGYKKWLARARAFDDDNPTPTDNGLTNIQYTESSDGTTRTYTWERGTNVAFVGLYEAVVASPPSSSAFPDPSTVPGTNGSLLSSTTNSWVATFPPKGSARVGLLVPYYKVGGGWALGDAVKVVVDPAPDVALMVRARITASTATTMTVRVAVADPYPQGADSATVTYTETGGTGTACSPASGGTVTPAATLTEAAGTYIDHTVTRPDFGSATRRVTFTVAANDRVSGTDAVDVPAQEGPGPVMDVVGTPGTTAFTITYTATGTLAYSVDGAAYASVPASPFTVSRNGAGGADKVLTFRCVRNSQTVTSMITVPPQATAAPTGAGFSAVSVTDFFSTDDEGAGTIEVTFAAVGLPTGTTYDVTIEILTTALGTPGVWDFPGVASGDDHTIPDLYSDSTGIATVFAIYGGNVVASGFVEFDLSAL